MHDFNIKKCLDYKVNKYNNTCHSTTKMKLVGVKSNALIDSGKRTNDKNSKFKIGDMLEHQNIETFLQNITLQFSIKKFL